MKQYFMALVGLMTLSAQAQIVVDDITSEPVLKVLPLGDIKPNGWLKGQMQKDMDGFIGHLDELVPELMNDPIYGEGRLHKNSKAKDLGNGMVGDAQGDEQYKWWNSETQSNWWDGYIRNAFLLGDEKAIERSRERVEYILSTQDEDGYLGINDREIRYKGHSENGELWAKATLLRGLLAYYEFTGDKRVWDAVLKAVDNVMENWPINASHPFDTGQEYNGGVGHGLVFTDVLDRLYQLTGNKKYEEYALFLYLDYSKWKAWEEDAQLCNVLNDDYKLKCHGVHTYEHLRPIIVAASVSDDQKVKGALNKYLKKIHTTTTATGGASGDEWIGGRSADATNMGYEFCSEHELMDSYSVLLQRTGNLALAEQIENIYYNAALGAKHPEYSIIAYLKTDNSYEMSGPRNGEADNDQRQTRYKYSPVHQDAAVCCVPNAGRITPYFLQNAWMLDSDSSLVANILMPNVLNTKIAGHKVGIVTETEYPAENTFTFRITANDGILRLKIRKPQWATGVSCSLNYKEENGYVLIEKKFGNGETFTLSFETQPRIIQTAKDEYYFAYGATIFALPLKSVEIKGREYRPGYSDYYYKPIGDTGIYQYIGNDNIKYENGTLTVYLKNTKTNTTEKVKLLPLRKTILRQAAF